METFLYYYIYYTIKQIKERIEMYVKWINKKYNCKKYSNNFTIN